MEKEERELKNETVVRLFDTYADDLYRFTISYVGSRQEAEDIVQDLFMKLVSKNIILGKEYEKANLMKMTVNMCKDYLKSSRTRLTVDYDSADKICGNSDEFTVKEKQLLDDLMSIKEKYRVPIYLHYYEGYSYREIAKILRISESAVAMRISRGKEVLKSRLEE